MDTAAIKEPFPSTSTGWYTNLAGDEHEEHITAYNSLHARSNGVAGPHYTTANNSSLHTSRQDALERGMRSNYADKKPRARLIKEYGGALVLSVFLAVTLLGLTGLLTSPANLQDLAALESTQLLAARPLHTATSGDDHSRLLAPAQLATDNTQHYVSLPIKKCKRVVANRSKEVATFARPAAQAVAEVTGQDANDTDNSQTTEDKVVNDGVTENKDDKKEDKKEDKKDDKKDDKDVENVDKKGDETDDINKGDAKDVKVEDTGTKNISVAHIRNIKDEEYVVTLLIGSNQQTSTVVLDTGSSNLWLASSAKIDIWKGHALYNHDSSTTYKPNGKLFNITYGEGHVEGFYSVDDVTIGGVVVGNFTFAEATSMEDFPSFGDKEYDGILGLGWPSIAQDGMEPLLMAAMRDAKLKDPVFSMKLGQNSENGMLTLGGYDEEQYGAKMTWLPVLNAENPTFWAVALGKMQVTMRSALLDVIVPFRTSAQNVIIDSGTSYLTGPVDDVRKLAEEVGAVEMNFGQMLSDGQYFVECNKTNSMPNIEFFLGENMSFSLKPENYIVHPTSHLFDDEGICTFAFLPLDLPGPSWILGDIFMQTVLTVFDVGQKRIGFAPLS